jgi:predicted O-linked N-acetylglucosamine transferase (SPINDLY family)
LLNTANLLTIDKRQTCTQSQCSLFLDTPLYNAHTTALEALWAAVPIVTLPLARMATRIAANEMAAVGLPLDTLVAGSVAEYEEIAVRLISTPRGRAELHELRENLVRSRLTHPLFDAPRWVRNWEVALQAMWEASASGKGRKRPHIVVHDPVAVPGSG